MVAISLQCLFIIQMPNKQTLINVWHDLWVMCQILNMFIRFLMYYLSNQSVIYFYSSRQVAALIQKQEREIKFIIIVLGW